MTPNRSVLFCALALTTTACVADEEDPVEETITEALAAGSIGNFGWFTGNDHDIGSAANMTCFITGLKGSLTALPSDPVTGNWPSAQAGVRLVNGRWIVRARNAGTAPDPQVQIGCINAVANRRLAATADGPTDLPFQNVAINANSACFLTNITGSGHGWDAYLENQPNPPPGVGIARSGTTAHVNVSLNQNPDNASSGSAAMVCVDIPNLQSGSWNATGPGEAVLPLSSPSQTACGFQSISGIFSGSTSTGVWLTNPLPDWKIKLTSSAFRARPYCAR
jgi:hypothetical protein